MKGQATIELLILFLVMIATVAMITQPLLASYSTMSDKNDAMIKRAAVENEIFAGEIWCNSGMSSTAPRQLLESAPLPMQVEQWWVEVEGGRYDASRFGGIFKGCTHEANRKFA